jgi:hypothetical protein
MGCTIAITDGNMPEVARIRADMTVSTVNVAAPVHTMVSGALLVPRSGSAPSLLVYGDGLSLWTPTGGNGAYVVADRVKRATGNVAVVQAALTGDLRYLVTLSASHVLGYAVFFFFQILDAKESSPCLLLACGIFRKWCSCACSTTSRACFPSRFLRFLGIPRHALCHACFMWGAAYPGHGGGFPGRV